MYQDLFSLNDKVALVSGGAGLLGGEIVRGLNEFGAKVYVADVQGAASSIGSESAAGFLPLDIGDETSVKNVSNH